MMDHKLSAALTRIIELESELEEQIVIQDLLHEDIADRDYRIRSLKGQLQNLKLDATYSTGVI